MCKKDIYCFLKLKNGKKGIKSGKVCKNEVEKFSPLRDLNSRPLVYKTSALTTELKRLLVGEELNNVGLLVCLKTDHKTFSLLTRGLLIPKFMLCIKNYGY